MLELEAQSIILFSVVDPRTRHHPFSWDFSLSTDHQENWTTNFVIRAICLVTLQQKHEFARYEIYYSEWCWLYNIHKNNLLDVWAYLRAKLPGSNKYRVRVRSLKCMFPLWSSKHTDSPSINKVGKRRRTHLIGIEIPSTEWIVCYDASSLYYYHSRSREPVLPTTSNEG